MSPLGPILTLTPALPEETRALGRRLGGLARPGTLLALVGDLGAGKTLFTQGVAAGLGIDPKLVTSPTFVLLNLLQGRLPLAHFDLYRLDLVDLPSLGFYDVRDSGVVVVEWADKVDESLLGDHLRIVFEHAGETSRRLMFHARGEQSAEILRAMNLSP
ncbi:MAG TPA: tRNA (adenosine(37)-N6)-threonylcarbamoyltransferase complex ATPase subunit type 1 TsaE [Planctomycetota bacterium]|nr:tRNA (adenosine(37)-N6)-threonylcarbamoyltransferase complex ATPase subunit type 1 TsaE [Planctomycetota bacterium]